MVARRGCHVATAVFDDAHTPHLLITRVTPTPRSCVGIYRNGRVEIIPNDQGSRITPSYVAWEGEERLVGDAAKNQVRSASGVLSLRSTPARREQRSCTRRVEQLPDSHRVRFPPAPALTLVPPPRTHTRRRRSTPPTPCSTSSA